MLITLLGEEPETGTKRQSWWAVVIAEALLRKACKGDVRAIAELANRIECKARQTVDLELDVHTGIMERLTAGRRRILEGMSEGELRARIAELKEQLMWKGQTNNDTSSWTGD